MDEIYQLLEPEIWSKEIVFGNVTYMDFEAYECAFCGRVHRGKQLSDMYVELYGSRFEDFVWLDIPEIVVTERVLALLERERITGFTSRPVHIVNGWRYGESPSLFQLKVFGSGGHLALEGGITRIDECQYCGYTAYSIPPDKMILVDPNQWDQSDIFIVPELPFYYFVTDEFVEVLKANNIRNYRLVGASWYVSW